MSGLEYSGDELEQDPGRGFGDDRASGEEDVYGPARVGDVEAVTLPYGLNTGNPYRVGDLLVKGGNKHAVQPLLHVRDFIPLLLVQFKLVLLELPGFSGPVDTVFKLDLMLCSTKDLHHWLAQTAFSFFTRSSWYLSWPHIRGCTPHTTLCRDPSGPS